MRLDAGLYQEGMFLVLELWKRASARAYCKTTRFGSPEQLVHVVRSTFNV